MAQMNIVEDIYRFVLQLSDDQIAHLNIKMLAKQFAVSRCHLSRRFRDERGITLVTFIQRRKLLLAEQLLLNEPELSVKELASRMGYADSQHFILRFREQWGESPGRYRKMFPPYES